MKIKTDYTGITWSDKYLTIHFRLEVGGTVVRASQVKVRMEALAGPVWQAAVEKAVRRKLIEIWSEQEIDVPFDV